MQALATVALVDRIACTDRGQQDGRVVDLPDRAEDPVGAGTQPAFRFAAVAQLGEQCPHPAQDLLRGETGIGGSAESVEEPFHVVVPAVAALSGQPGDHLPFPVGAALPHVDGAAARGERLIVRGDPLGHGQRALLAQGAHEFAEQVPRFVFVQAELVGERRRQRHVLGAVHADTEQSAPFQRLPVVGGDEFPHHPQAHGALPALPGGAPLEVPGSGGPVSGVADQVVHPENVVGEETVLESFDDESPLLQERVAAFQVGGAKNAAAWRLSLKVSSLRPPPGRSARSGAESSGSAW